MIAKILFWTFVLNCCLIVQSEIGVSPICTALQYDDSLLDTTDYKVNRDKRDDGQLPDDIKVKLWPLPILYEIDREGNNGIPRKKRKMIFKAMTEIMTQTCVTWRWAWRKSEQDNSPGYVMFTRKWEGCWAEGFFKKKKPQYVNYVDSCFNEYGTIVHELVHVLGVFHAHQHPNREKYIYVDMDTVIPKDRQWLKTLAKGNPAALLHEPYDLASIVHYRPSSYTKRKGGITIRTVDPTMQQVIGQKSGLSFGDARLINRMYCSDKCTQRLPQPCQRGGYQDPKACDRCRCPTVFGGKYCERLKSTNKQFPCRGTYTVTKPVIVEAPTSKYGYRFARPHYNVGQECNWYFKAASSDQRLGMRFIGDFSVFAYFHDKICYHWVEVQYKKGLDTLGHRFCGLFNPNERVISEGNEMAISFRSDYPAPTWERLGFKIEVYPINGRSKRNKFAKYRRPVKQPSKLLKRPGRPKKPIKPEEQQMNQDITSQKDVFQFKCSFEGEALCGMTQQNDDSFDWTVHEGVTQSKDTGPSSAQHGNYYIFIEASNKAVGDNAKIEIPAVSSNGQYCLTFYYNMNGFHIGHLAVYAGNNQVWRKDGNQGDEWTKVSLKFRLAAQEKVVFDGVVGGPYSGDIALDNIHMTSC